MACSHKINVLQFGIDKADRIYDDLPDMEKIGNVLQDYLDDYNLTNPKEVKLVFFQDAIEHVSRYSATRPPVKHRSYLFFSRRQFQMH